jgi:uncharacterized membrane protein
MNKETTRSGGIGFFDLLGIAFIVLKLTGYIDWSWWWVTAPLWGTLAALIAIIAIMLLIAGILSVIGILAERSTKARR